MQQRIKTRFGNLGKKILKVKDMSKGCDQYVFLVVCEDGKYVHKEAKKQKNKISNGLKGLKLAKKLKIV